MRDSKERSYELDSAEMCLSIEIFGTFFHEIIDTKLSTVISCVLFSL